MKICWTYGFWNIWSCSGAKINSIGSCWELRKSTGFCLPPLSKPRLWVSLLSGGKSFLVTEWVGRFECDAATRSWRDGEEWLWVSAFLFEDSKGMAIFWVTIGMWILEVLLRRIGSLLRAVTVLEYKELRGRSVSEVLDLEYSLCLVKKWWLGFLLIES